MHKKLLIFFGLLAGVTLLTSVLHTDSAFAKGEKYKWTSATTVEASGGKYTGTTTFTVAGDQLFQGSKTELYTSNMGADVAFGACGKGPGRIVILGNRDSGNLYVGELATNNAVNCGRFSVNDSGIDMDFKITIAAQSETGSGTNWDTKNCNAEKDDNAKAECAAIKACVVDKKKPAADCESAWKACIAPNKSAEAYKSCAKQVSAGNTKDAKYTPSEEDETNKTSCKIEGIGWLVCPVARLMAKVVDGAYTGVAYFLEVPAVENTTTSDLYKAWSIMRNFANVAFVIAFMIIIYSQITGAGVSNYGIKRMLPRLIIAAILVNISYWICAIAVDLSNIVGSSMKGLLEGASKQLYTTGSTSQSGAGGVWDGITDAVLIGGAAVAIYASLSALLPLLVTAVFAIVMVLLILTIRQALIIVLIVLSPLAFVAFLLPNTQSLFKKWQQLFVLLLLVFPIVGLLFGACSLASAILTANAGDNWFIQLMGAGVGIIPLIITPLVIKTTSGLATRWAGYINDPNKGVFDRARKRAEGYRDYRRNVNRGNRLDRAGNIMSGDGKILGKEYSKRRRALGYLASAGATTAVNNERKRNFAQAVANENAQDYFAQRALSQPGFAEDVAGNDKMATSVKAWAQSEVDKTLKQDIINREVLLSASIEFKNNPQAALNQALQDNDKVQAAAAISMLMKTGASGYGKIYDSISSAEAAGRGNTDTMEAVRDFVKENGKTIKAKDPALIRWATQPAVDDNGNAITRKTVQQMAGDAGVFKKSDAEVAAFAPAAFERAANTGAITKEQAKSILLNPNIVKDTSPENMKVLQDLVKGVKPDGTPAPSAPTTTQTASGPSASGAAPTPQQATAPYSRTDLQSIGPQGIQMVINNAGGPARLSDGDLAKIINATRGQAGADIQNIYNTVRAERDRRQGFTGTPTPPTSPTPPTTPPSTPPSPPSP